MNTQAGVKEELLASVTKISELIPQIGEAIHLVDRLQEVFAANHTIQEIFQTTPREELEAMLSDVDDINFDDVFRITKSIEATFAELPLEQFADAMRSADNLTEVFVVMNTIQQTIADYLSKKIMQG